jgi:hypothetical protein
MFSFIKGLFRSKKNEESCECGHCDTNIGSEASVTVTPTPKPKAKQKRKPSGKRSNTPAKMSAKTSYNESTSPNVGQNTSGDFATSMIVAQATDNAAVGFLVGGDPLGAVIGASMADHSETHHIQYTDYSADSAMSTETTTHYHDHTPSYDSSPSYDTTSYSDSTSYDSSSSDGGDW